MTKDEKQGVEKEMKRIDEWTRKVLSELMGDLGPIGKSVLEKYRGRFDRAHIFAEY